ncbi:helix-hairpin-helix domain-containing protein [Nocardioides sp. GY 10127]|uniref:helix-hairpin-helix domain-containing protein n=1 Tax=Nocardioides sp. GY 10127 TaxID=2569762 RepID=UPI001F0E3816|nr:helix-hairpin-helix domain-containing protein [Nocardioides sp. GY 10127]
MTTLLSMGVLTIVPFFHAASHLGRPALQKAGVALSSVAFISFVLVGLAPEDAEGTPTGVLSTIGASLILAVLGIACAWLIGLRREVYSRAPDAPSVPAADPNREAVAQVEAQRRKRAEARLLAQRDPAMARELGVGDPGRSGYDDGGLVDLNVVSAADLVTRCGLSAEVAGRIVEARARLGRFLQVEDAVLFGDLEEREAAALRERGLVIE